MDPLRLELKIGMFFIVTLHWTIAVAVPAFIFGYVPAPKEWAVAVLFTAIVGYCSYTGYRAWKRRWRSRFILRAVIPGLLFLFSSVWFGFLALKLDAELPT
jgi:hypothetical protein